MAQLKISDLSVGDWVNLDNPLQSGAGQIVEIRSNIVLVQVPSCVVGARLGSIEPIPLTPEILEKNGWKYETYTIEDIIGIDIEYKCYRHTFYRDSYRYDIVLEDSYGGYYQCSIESSIPDEDGELRFISDLCSLGFVEYLHQLQHALRLAGVEKEIEL